MAAATILVVEDEPHIQELLRFYLEDEGFEVEMISTGAEALARLGGEPPALAILDIMIAQMSGLEILERIRSNDRWAGVPVLMLTARSGEADVAAAFDAGADDYVTKPFQLESLVGRVSRLLKGRATGEP